MTRFVLLAAGVAVALTGFTSRCAFEQTSATAGGP
jgi:hypothetical protein